MSPKATSARSKDNHLWCTVRKSIAQIQKNEAKAIEPACRAGIALGELRRSRPRGIWIKDFEAEIEPTVGFTIRTAQRWIRLAKWGGKNYRLLDSKGRFAPQRRTGSNAPDDLLSLSLTEIYRLIAKRPQPGRTKRLPTVPGNDWLTPVEVIAPAMECLGGSISLDPCGAREFPDQIPAKECFFPETNGLAPERAWHGTALVNPGHRADIDAWLRAARFHVSEGTLESALCVVPAITDADWVEQCASYARAFLRRRLPVLAVKDGVTYEARLPVPMMLVYITRNPNIDAFARAFGETAEVLVPYR